MTLVAKESPRQDAKPLASRVQIVYGRRMIAQQTQACVWAMIQDAWTAGMRRAAAWVLRVLIVVGRVLCGYLVLLENASGMTLAAVAAVRVLAMH